MILECSFPLKDHFSKPHGPLPVSFCRAVAMRRNGILNAWSKEKGKGEENGKQRQKPSRLRVLGSIPGWGICNFLLFAKASLPIPPAFPLALCLQALVFSCLLTASLLVVSLAVLGVCSRSVEVR